MFHLLRSYTYYDSGNDNDIDMTDDNIKPENDDSYLK